MTEENLTDFSFRGHRNYVYGPTAFNWLVAKDPDPHRIDFSFHKMTGNQCRLSSRLDEESAANHVATYKSDGGVRYLYETEVPVASRVDCNERDILTQVTLAGREGSFRLPIEGAMYSECAVATYKAMLQGLYPDFKKKLAFARLIIDEVPTEGAFLVRHKRAIAGDFFEAKLYRDDTPMGTLIFGAL
jgi:hypothetical protein